MKPEPRISQLAITFGLAKFALLAQTRNRAALVFSFIFPLGFVLVFGSFGNGSNPVQIGVPTSVSQSDPIYQALSAMSVQGIVKITSASQESLETTLGQSKLDGVYIPGAKPELETTSSNMAGSATSKQLFNGIVSRLNYESAKKAAGPSFSEPFQINQKEISGHAYRYIDFALPGQIGFSMLSLSTFGVAFSMISFRKQLILKRMFATSVRPLSFVFSQCLSRSVQAMLQTAVILLVGHLAFNYSPINGFIGYIEMLILAFLGILSFFGFGILISNVARDEQSAPIVINLFSLPQFLLGGIFFPINGLPSWLQFIGNNLPLSYLTNSLRKISVDGQHLPQLWPYILGMAGWSLVSYVAAAKTFRSE